MSDEDWLAFFEDGSFVNIGRHADLDAAEEHICNTLDEALYFGTRSWWIDRINAARVQSA